MAHEERTNRAAFRYLEAKERKLDYEKYYTLTQIFGKLPQELFDRTPRPGKYFFLVVVVAVVIVFKINIKH